jgi:hypothetical protein
MAWLNGILLWIHSDKELDEFFEHANSIHPSIKFTQEVSKTKISFLDTTTTFKEGNMITDLYSKPSRMLFLLISLAFENPLYNFIIISPFLQMMV